MSAFTSIAIDATTRVEAVAHNTHSTIYLDSDSSIVLHDEGKSRELAATIISMWDQRAAAKAKAGGEG